MARRSSPATQGSPRHLSHSSRETLERCAKQYFLSRIAKAPSRPALWLAGGSAVHEVTELWDRDQVFVDADEPLDISALWSERFNAHLAEMRQREPKETSWRWSKTEPIEVWNQMGPEFVRAYIDWRKRSPWTIWTTPDGVPAIELDVAGMLPGCPVEIKGFVDRVFHDPVFDRLVIVDLKTGKSPPKTPDQFGTYAALIEVKYDALAELGAAFMNRKATLGTPYDLKEYTPEHVGETFGKAWEQVESGDFPANGFDKECFICDVSAACYAKNGPLAARYDPAHPNHPSNTPPF